ncbi:MAG TPA: alpha/beta hydrolase [Gammaproteobacteria bacterium]|mgnify:FL=1|nr:MAG: alpha/beta hydrolase [OM182 bacterium]HAL41303.1 alpha/beta hydrolase [Gammaproteobacteria bacterium]HBP99201.1 alpha/beta hydrolase [Gammaproteobacteria bacterium]|tara:strand:- start:4505 stop:5395 length:891 start_codon:yes stop_codon:yes gene_type:complete
MARWDQGEGSAIPEWFWEAVDIEPQCRTVEVEECDVAYRLYPADHKPGMLLIHGMNAHARWWDFIAPQLNDQYQVAAMDLTGMGDSDYRYRYSGETYANEIVAVIEDAGLGPNPLIVAHSFGGYMAVKAANLFPDRFGGLVLVDSGIRHPDDPAPDRGNMWGGQGKIYPDRETALVRFRLQPPQPCANDYILQYIARHSLMPMDGGWAWKFDEDLLTTLTETERQPEEYMSLTLPLGVIFGADSESFSHRMLGYMQELVPNEFPYREIADAQHHVFLDQPLAFVSALKELSAELRS